VLAILPQDAYDMLDLAHRITAHAYTQRVALLEQETQRLQQQSVQKVSQIKALERRVENLVMEVNEANEKARQYMEEQTKLVGEKNALIGTVKKLNRDVSKLENFKRNLLQSLQDDDEGGVKDISSLGTDISSERLVSNVLSSARGTPAPAGHPDLRTTTPAPPMSAAAGLAPTPALSGLSGSPRAVPTPAVTGLSPPPGASPRVDGKEFFRQARARLGYEEFSQFLQNIKELNAGRQSREDTLHKAEEIFGAGNADLFRSFESLLSRHLPAM